MKQKKIAIVGIGKLGSALLKHWDGQQLSIGVYHPKIEKANVFVQSFTHAYTIKEKNFSSFDIVILCLPPAAIVPFLNEVQASEDTLFINMATSLQTEEIRTELPSLSILGIKYMGQAGDLAQRGNGLFISEKEVDEDVQRIFEIQGSIIVDQEEKLNEANTIAAYYALKATIELEEAFKAKGFPELYAKRALSSTIPGVIRSYSEDSLGHFALKILDEVKKERLEHQLRSSTF